ncbi:DUF2625 family protein [Paenibacillus contaminans]|uniref:DUF2625 domain-containing protein n=1 Tax=Paenibacillus contaminans TaxID=450362 RepID=A0A329M838_9BACL|nr:DUF2625 family protein [Paenibacillus contaminans]RAV14853.1 DUF2625 domain-containing protein [Paenibacillus contaminans]
MKGIEELVYEGESALTTVENWIFESKNSNQAIILPSEIEMSIKVITDLQVTTKSILGAIAYSTGGILFQNGWLRILGSGHDKLPRTITSWSEQCDMKHALLVADDVVGGFFALNCGFLDEGVGEIFYFAPDILDWEPLEMGYSDFVHWACTGDLHTFYETFRWNGWETYVADINGNQGISIYPPLWTKESNQQGIENCSKKTVPLEELWGLHNHMREQLNKE